MQKWLMLKAANVRVSRVCWRVFCRRTRLACSGLSATFVHPMNLCIRLTTLLFTLAGLCLADLAPSPDLLPTNTLAVLSIPEVSVAKSAWLASNPGDRFG